MLNLIISNPKRDKYDDLVFLEEIVHQTLHVIILIVFCVDRNIYNI